MVPTTIFFLQLCLVADALVNESLEDQVESRHYERPNMVACEDSEHKMSVNIEKKCYQVGNYALKCIAFLMIYAQIGRGGQ